MDGQDGDGGDGDDERQVEWGIDPSPFESSSDEGSERCADQGDEGGLEGDESAAGTGGSQAPKPAPTDSMIGG